MKTIDLKDLTGGGEVHNLSGRERGLAARERFGLDEIDGSGEEVEVIVPSHVYAVTPSFIQGLLGKSVQANGNDALRFRSRFRFVAPAIVLQQLDRGLSAILTSRNLAGVR